MKFSAFLLSAVLSSCSVTKIYVVRHAEKTGNTANADLKDPEGFERAIALRDSLKNTGITGVFSTNVPRTIHTGQPTAEANNLGVVFYKNADSLIDKLVLKKKKTFLVVGHSNTVAPMIRHIGLDPGFTGDIPDNDFDNLFVITIRFGIGSATKSIVRKTYGKLSP